MKITKAVQPQLVEALRNDHKRASRLIQLLTDQIEGLVRFRPLDLEIAQGVFRYMTDFVDRQHHAREDFLFDLLGQRDPAVRHKVQQADSDHQKLEREGAKVVAALATLIERPSLGVKSFSRRVRRYRDLLIEHFHYEEARLFAAAEKLGAAEWSKIEKAVSAAEDPLFGAEVEASFQSLFDIYVNHISEIGRPVLRPATVSAAVLTDSAAEVLSGSRSVIAELRRGAAGIIKANLSGASALAGSRSLSQFCSNAINWSRASFDETTAVSGQVFGAVERTARSAIAPFGNALGTEVREFDVSHRPDRAAVSWQANIVNLALRATVKRMASASSGDLPIPDKNIEVPRMAIERFIPQLADDVAVERIELAHAFAEVMTIKGTEPGRTILFFPGGGFMLAPTQAHRLMAARMARGANARVVMVHYRLAPEYRFPAGLNDCVDAYRALLDTGVAPRSIVVIGDSAGGGMALSTLLRIRGEGLAMPAAAVLLSPVTDLSYSGESRRGNSWSDPSLPNDDRNLIAQVYLGTLPQNDPLASPLFADLSGLPPMLIQVGSTEILLDDALRVAAKIRAQGGDCECEVWHDMPHDWMLFGILPEARKALRRIVGFVKDRSPTESVRVEKPAERVRAEKVPAGLLVGGAR